MKQYVKFWEKDEDSDNIEEFNYQPAISGEIELDKISEKTTILKIYFRKINTLRKSTRFFELFDGSTEIMLANFPVKINDLRELDKTTIEIKKGWSDKQLFTMLSVRDGEPINNSKISFSLNNDDSIHINWIGSYPSYQSGNDIGRLELNIIAFPKENVVTPLCSNDKELIETFEN